MAEQFTKMQSKVVGSIENKRLSFTMSSDAVDSYGDVVEAAGWRLERFATNPIALFNHNHDLPVGSWENVRIEGNALKGLAQAQIQAATRIPSMRSVR